jgi:lysophospholipase L1-like esterase
METDVLALKPQHVILLFGMNDAMNSANLVPLPDYRRNMRAMVRTLRDAGTQTIALVTLNPVIEPYVQARHPNHPRSADLQGWLRMYDQVIRDIAAEHKLPLIDLRAMIEEHGGAAMTGDSLIRCEANGGGRDGVHLMPAAYEKLGALAFAVLKERVRSGDKVVCFGDSLTCGVGVKGQGDTVGETYPAVLQRCFAKSVSRGATCTTRKETRSVHPWFWRSEQRATSEVTMGERKEEGTARSAIPRGA